MIYGNDSCQTTFTYKLDIHGNLQTRKTELIFSREATWNWQKHISVCSTFSYQDRVKCWKGLVQWGSDILKNINACWKADKDKSAEETYKLDTQY